jgi:hypothetical protein
VIVVCKIVDAEAEVEEQPDDDDWSKASRNSGNAERLDSKEEDQNRTSDANDRSVA